MFSGGSKENIEEKKSYFFVEKLETCLSDFLKQLRNHVTQYIAS